jgi:formylglycine-generating enzyme required for sulfatase activity
MRIPTGPGVRRGEALRWVLIIIVVLCLVGAGVLYVQRRHRDPGSAARKLLQGPAVTLDLGKGVTLELVRIEPGSFTMGSPESEADHDLSEEPQHKVTINKAFYVGKYEVTQKQWGVKRGPLSQFKGENLPTDGASWGDAKGWCADISKELGIVVRLPTEAEWEYACRAGTTTPWSSGATLTTDVANFKAANLEHTSPVGSHKANAWGLYDMHGNVWEWCEDTLQPDYTGAPADGSPWIDAQNKYNRVRRGGSWSDPAGNCRSAVRFGSAGSEKEPDMRNNQVGFRVVVEVPTGK